MRCPKCKAQLGDGLLPARCPHCGQVLGGRDAGGKVTRKAQREKADEAAASRKGVEGLSGMGRGNRGRGSLAKAVVRIVLGLVLVAGACALVYVVLDRAEIIGGRTVPDVVGWRSERAALELENDGFGVALRETASVDVVEGMVVSLDPEAGTRAPEGSTVTVEVSTGPDEAATEAGASGEGDSAGQVAEGQ